MKIAIIYNKDMTGVINTFGMQNKEVYSPKTVKEVTKALEAGGHNVEVIDGNMHVVESLSDFMPKVMHGERMGMVFNMAYGIQGESRYTHVPSMLEMLGIPYVGSSPSGHALALDKVITKIVMQQHQIPTPKFWVFNHHEENMTGVEFPVIVKPKMESVSFGLKVVYNQEELREAIQFIISEFDQQALVEQFIRGREFAVGLIGNNPIEAFPVLEFDLDNDPDAIQTVDDKKKAPRKKICPSHITEEIANQMVDLSKKAFNALQLRDFARVDIRMDENNNIFLLEINSMASLGPTGSYVHAAQIAGYNYKTLVNKMLDVATVRYFADTNFPVLQGNNKKQPLHIRIRSFLRGRQDYIETLLEKMVNTNSYVRNVEGVNQLGNLLKKQLSALGFAYESIPQIEVGNILFFSNSDNENYDFLLLGNLDNRKKIADIEYFSRTEQKLFGTGIWEHKGGLTVMLAALQALRFTRHLKKYKIGILLTTDDSLQGKFARKVVAKKSQSANYVIGLHGASLNGSVVNSRSGAAVYKFDINLKKTGIAENVSKAAAVFTSIINSWIDLSNKEDGLVISPHQMTFNSNITEPYAHGEVSLSVRFNNNNQLNKIDEKIRRLVNRRQNANLHLHIEGGERRPAMAPYDNGEFLWTKAKSIAEKLDIQLSKEHRWSSADICFVDDSKYKLDGFGPIGNKPLKKSEYILKHSLLERAALLAMLIYEIKK